MRIGLIFCCWIVAWSGSLAQGQGAVVTKNFTFRDGVYLRHESFQRNQPDYALEDVRASLFTNPQTFLTQVASISVKKEGQFTPLPLDSIWMLSLGGIPYVRLPEGAINKELTTFAGLQLRGKICYFRYENLESRQIPIRAYNPANQKPFREAIVERDVTVLYEKILHFETGKIVDFTVENFLQWIQDDPGLVVSVEELAPQEAREKLFKCLLIYVDRNMAFIR